MRRGMFLAAVLASVNLAIADTINVPADYRTIQAAIDAAAPGDEILVAPGTYKEAEIDFMGKAIAVRSSDGPRVTIIDPSGIGQPAVQCHLGEGPDTIFQGFTVTGVSGSGMQISNSSPTVIDCVFSSNSLVGLEVSGDNSALVVDSKFIGNGVRGMNASGNVTVINCIFVGNGRRGTGGGVITGPPGNPMLLGCTFTDNQANEGGGLANGSNTTTVISCIFSGNSATQFGGAVFNTFSNSTFTNCVFFENNALLAGGAIFNNRSDAVLRNCTLSGNTAALGGGMLSDNFSFPTLANCVYWDNSPDEIIDQDSLTTATYTDVSGGWPGRGNIDADPLFVDPDNGDYHLSPGSPCIDAADNTAVPKGIDTDLDGNPRFVDDPATKDTGNGDPPIVDMGAYEFQPLLCPWDLDNNGSVGASDLLTLLANWGNPYGASDLLALLANWGPCP